MKKITFFLCALLISAMSFAGEATLSFANKAQRTSFSTSTQVWVQNGITVTNNKSKSTSNVGDYANPARFYKSSELIVECSEGNITKIVFDCNSPSYATAMQTSIGAAATASSDKVTVILDGSSTSFAVSSLGGQVRMDAITVTYAAGEGEVNAPSIPISQNFLSSLEITMTLVGEGDIYYTLDGTDPTTTSTKYTAPFTITETTTVKAIAENGGKASSIATATYTKVEPLTTMDAIFAKATAADQQVFVTFNNWIVTGVKNSNAYVTDGTKGLIIYQSGHGLVVGDVLSGTIECTLVLYKGSAELKGVTSKTSGLIVTEGGEAPVNELNEESIAALGGVHTGSVIKISGEVTTSSSKYYINGVQLYNSLFEFGTLEEGEQYDCIGVYCQFDTTKEVMPRSAEDLVKIETGEPLIKAEDELTFDAIAFGDEVEAQTLIVTGANLTAEITATLDNEKFTVTPATLPAAGGDLTIAPAADLTVGEHAATLTLTSGETTKEVTLSILVKDVYAIEWYVNGEIYDETTVVEGDKLVLPAAPEAPEACSEKVFVGWTAAEEVNANGSEIEWVTAATAPTAAATYYAVFAAQEGEGGASEVVDVLNRALTGVEGTNYTDWEDVSATSTAVYAGQSAGGKEAIQLRSNNSNSGVISTTSGGKLAKVVVTWNGETAAGRTLNVYGSNTAYTSPTELYGDASGEKLGTIVCGTSTELVIEGDYAYVGLRSNSGAMYLDEIQITWIAGAAATYTDYSTTCEPEIPTYSVTVSDNTGGFEPITTGGGEYKEGDNATVTASEEVEGWVFVGWMANEEFVANDPTYTFAVEGNTELVAIYATAMEDEITNLVIDPYMMVLIGGPSTTWQVEVTLGLGEDNGEGGFLLSDESYVSIMGEDATWIDGMAFDIDLDANVATAIVVVEFGGTYYAFTLTMSAAPAEPIEVVVENATVTLSKYTVSETESAYELTMVADWTYEKDGLTYEVECLLPTFDPTNESGNYAANFFVRGDGDAFGMAEGANVLVTVENQTLKLTGEISAFNGNVYNVTISGTLPAVPSALDNVTTTVAPVKAIVNGQLVIVKDGVQYNAQGAVIK